MKNLRTVAAAAALACCISAMQASAKERDYTRYVNPLMGTMSTFAFSAGNTYPAIARPWGMNFWTPQTGKMGDGWAYVYSSLEIRGFKQTHQPSPWINDYGQFSLMPTVGLPSSTRTGGPAGSPTRPRQSPRNTTESILQATT